MSSIVISTLGIIIVLIAVITVAVVYIASYKSRLKRAVNNENMGNSMPSPAGFFAVFGVFVIAGLIIWLIIKMGSITDSIAALQNNLNYNLAGISNQLGKLNSEPEYKNFSSIVYDSDLDLKSGSGNLRIEAIPTSVSSDAKIAVNLEGSIYELENHGGIYSCDIELSLEKPELVECLNEGCDALITVTQNGVMSTDTFTVWLVKQLPVLSFKDFREPINFNVSEKELEKSTFTFSEYPTLEISTRGVELPDFSAEINVFRMVNGKSSIIETIPVELTYEGDDIYTLTPHFDSTYPAFDNVSFFLYLRLENGLSIYFGDFLNVSLDSVQTSDYLEADLLFE
ncbi:MAG: hypothetical protein J5890_03915 [Clostridia bacterium]|nr:hypothetical protein [Clostridia bacterium]